MANVGETQEAMRRPGPGWLECIGLSVRRDEFPELFAKIGSRHGSLNEAHFNLPSTPYTYIYAGGSAETIGETLPSVPGVSPDMVPVAVPPSPIFNMPMEVRPGSVSRVGPEDPAPAHQLLGGPPGGMEEVERGLAEVVDPQVRTGMAYAAPIEEKAAQRTVQELDERDEISGQAAKTAAASAREAGAEVAAEGAQRTSAPESQKREQGAEAERARAEAQMQRGKLTAAQQNTKTQAPRG